MTEVADFNAESTPENSAMLEGFVNQSPLPSTGNPGAVEAAQALNDATITAAEVPR
jgi:hypothetical protein